MQQPPRMRLFQGSPSTFGGAAASLCPRPSPFPAKLGVFIALLTYLHPSPGPGEQLRAAAASGAWWDAVLSAPSPAQPRCSPRSRGCAGSSHRPTQPYLRIGNFTARPGGGSRAMCFVLYLLLQLGEPQRNTCYFLYIYMQ